MKKMPLISIIICFIPSLASADVVNGGHPSATSAWVKEGMRQIISPGVQNQGLINMTETMFENKYKK